MRFPFAANLSIICHLDYLLPLPIYASGDQISHISIFLFSSSVRLPEFYFVFVLQSVAGFRGIYPDLMKGYFRVMFLCHLLAVKKSPANRAFFVYEL